MSNLKNPMDLAKECKRLAVKRGVWEKPFCGTDTAEKFVKDILKSSKNDQDKCVYLYELRNMLRKNA